MPGSMPATSQLDWLSSMTAMIVLFWSRATRDLLKSFGWGIAGTPSIRYSDEVAISRRPPHSIYRSLSQRCGFILVEEKGPQIDQACLERRRQPVIRPAVLVEIPPVWSVIRL